MEIEPFIVNVSKEKLVAISQLKYKIDINFELELHFKYETVKLLDVFFYIPSRKTTNVENAKKYVINLVFPEDKTSTSVELHPMLIPSFESGFLVELLEIKYGLYLVQDKNKIKIVGDWKDVNNFVMFADNVNKSCTKTNSTPNAPLNSKNTIDSKISNFIDKSRFKCLSEFVIEIFLKLPQEIKHLLYLWITTEKEIDIPFDCLILPTTMSKPPLAVIDLGQSPKKEDIRQESPDPSVAKLRPAQNGHPSSSKKQKIENTNPRVKTMVKNNRILLVKFPHNTLDTKINLVNALTRKISNLCLSQYKIEQLLTAINTDDVDTFPEMSCVIIDGFNVMKEAGKTDLSIFGLRSCIEYFEEKYSKILIFMPPNIQYSELELMVIRDLQNKGYLLYFEHDYDSSAIGLLAAVTKGLLVSNFYKKEYFKWIIKRPVRFTFNGNTFHPALS